MPIITITSKDINTHMNLSELVTELKDSGARALETSPSNIWVVFQNGLPLSSSEQDHPPIIEIKALSGRTSEMKSQFVRTVTEKIAKVLNISPKIVWVHYHEMRPQDVWVDGGWVK